MARARPAVVVTQGPTAGDSSRDDLAQALAFATGNTPLAAAAIDKALGRAAAPRSDPGALAYGRAWRRVAAAAGPGSGIFAPLTPEQRSMVFLRHRFGWDAARIAVAHGVAAGDVEAALHEAHRALGIDHEQLRAELAAAAAVNVPPPIDDLPGRSRRLAAATVGVAALFSLVVWQAGGTGLDIPEPAAVPPAPSLAAIPPQVVPAEGAGLPAPAPLGPSLTWEKVRLPSGVRFDHVAVRDGTYYAIASARSLPGEVGEIFTTWTSSDGATWSLAPGDSTAFGADAVVTGWTVGEAGLIATGGRAVRPIVFGASLMTDPTVWTSPTGRVWSGAKLDTELASDDPFRHWTFATVAVAAAGDVVAAMGTAFHEIDLAAVAAGQGPEELPAGFFYGYGGPGSSPYLYGPGAVPVRELATTPEMGLDDHAPGEVRRTVAWRSQGGGPWERIDLQDLIGPGAIVTDLQALGTGFVAQGFDARGQVSWWSADGRDWEELSFSGDGPRPVGALADWDGLTVARSAGGNVYLSPDGEQWTSVQLADTAVAQTGYGQIATGPLGIVVLGSVFGGSPAGPIPEIVVPGGGADLVFDLDAEWLEVRDSTGESVLAAPLRAPGAVVVDFDARTVEVVDRGDGSVVFAADLGRWQAAALDARDRVSASPVSTRVWYSADGQRWSTQEVGSTGDAPGFAVDSAVGPESAVVLSLLVDQWPVPHRSDAALWIGRPTG